MLNGRTLSHALSIAVAVGAIGSITACGGEEDQSDQAVLVEQATFKDNLTYNGFNVACTAAQKALINAAQARAIQILGIAMPANADARVHRTTQKAGIFRTYFVPNASTNPDPKRTMPDEWDTATFRVGQKLSKVSQVLSSAVHTCHGGNESAVLEGGVFKTCNQKVGLAASTNFEGGADNAIRWCDYGLSQSVDERAITLLHELTHQDRTADATGGRVYDDSNTGRLYNAHNYSSWFRNNEQ